MIEAKDLRLGNLFHYWPAGSEKVIDKVSALRTTSKTFAQLLIKGEKSGWNQETQCHPIELQPEILEAAGFVNKKITGKDWSNDGDVIETWVNESGNMVIQGRNVSYSIAFRLGLIKNNLEYVHQLQNLYHSLTGEEIKIKLPTTGKE